MSVKEHYRYLKNVPTLELSNVTVSEYLGETILLLNPVDTLILSNCRINTFKFLENNPKIKVLVLENMECTNPKFIYRYCKSIKFTSVKDTLYPLESPLDLYQNFNLYHEEEVSIPSEWVSSFKSVKEVYLNDHLLLLT